MTQFSNTCGASPVNNQIFLLNGHGSYFDECSLKQMKCQNIHQFLLKEGETTQPMTRPMMMHQMTNWSLSAIRWRMREWWSMGRQSFYLNTWTPSWWKHGTPSMCHLETALGRYLLKKSNPYHPSKLNKKYPGICWLHYANDVAL